MNNIHIAAAIIVNSSGETLLVRKRDTDFFMQAGGKIDDGETALDALCREIKEELGLTVQRHACLALGQFEANAANEHNHHVIADLFLLEADFAPKPEAEIAEAVWRAPLDAREIPLAPLTRDHVMPIVEQHLAARKRNKA